MIGGVGGEAVVTSRSPKGQSQDEMERWAWIINVESVVNQTVEKATMVMF